MEWYQIAARILVPALIFGGMPFVMLLIFKLRDKEEAKTSKSETVVLKYPNFYAYVGMFTTVFWTIFLIFSIVQDGTLFPCVVFGTFLMVSLYLIILPITKRIAINEKEKYIISRSFFGFKKNHFVFRNLIIQKD